MTIPTPPTDYVFHQGEALDHLHAGKPANPDQHLAAANAHGALAIAAAIDAVIRTVRDHYEPIPYALVGRHAAAAPADVRPSLAYPLPDGVIADFTRRCRRCGRTVTAAGGNPEPHGCRAAQNGADEPLADWEQQVIHWEARRRLVSLSQWIDESLADRPAEAQQTHRVIKVAEESGEAIAALIGYLGVNPRKGTTHTRNDVIQELLDVAVTALGAVEHLTNNVGAAFDLLDQKICDVANRAGLVPITNRS